MLALPGAAALAWLAGFAWFLHVTSVPPPPPPVADGIVALTGGPDRVETALRLLADGRARLLLVSGVGGDAGFGDLAHRAGADPSLRGRVTLGRVAASTRGNADETAEWAGAHAIESLIVVTAAYHMPRALVELGRTLPGVALYPLPVQLEAAGASRPWRLLAEEYVKWLVSEAGLSALTSRIAPARTGPARTALPRTAPPRTAAPCVLPREVGNRGPAGTASGVGG